MPVPPAAVISAAVPMRDPRGVVFFVQATSGYVHGGTGGAQGKGDPFAYPTTRPGDNGDSPVKLRHSGHFTAEQGSLLRLPAHHFEPGAL